MTSNTPETTTSTEQPKEIRQTIGDDEIKGLSLNDAVKKIQQQLVLDPTNQYKRDGKIFQRVAKLRPNTNRIVYVSLVVDHTPGSRYTGAKLRALRSERIEKSLGN